MKPGPELDALIAEKVMGWKKTKLDVILHATMGLMWPYDAPKTEFKSKSEQEILLPPNMNINEIHWAGDGMNIIKTHIPAYSEDISAAWLVVEHLSLLSSNFLIDDVPWKIASTLDPSGIRDIVAIGETAPHAICMAALKTVGIE